MSLPAKCGMTGMAIGMGPQVGQSSSVTYTEKTKNMVILPWNMGKLTMKSREFSDLPSNIAILPWKVSI